jgi:hypothetical protein
MGRALGEEDEEGEKSEDPPVLANATRRLEGQNGIEEQEEYSF